MAQVLNLFTQMKMRLSSVVFFVLACLCALPLTAQSPQEVMKSIESAIKNKDAVVLSQFFNKDIEITLSEDEKVYSKNQAQLVIKDFFSRNPLTRFNMIHVGGAGDSWYGMGMYESASGQFDTNVFIKKYGSVYLIERIRFENKD